MKTNSKGKNNYLITGTSNGLGKYLHDNLGGISFVRSDAKDERAEIIIHCAFNSEHNPKDLDQYFKDNVFLTGKLTKISHGKFIFISSVDVYPKDSKKHLEDEIININEIDGLYGVTKLMSEHLVKNNCPNFLILRCTALIGKDSRKNSLIRVIEEDNLALTLSEKSVFNYILHSDVLKFIKLAIKKDLKGVYNLASSKNITLKEVTNLFKKRVKFGNYIYNVGNIDNDKASNFFPDFKKTSKEIISEFGSSIF